MGWFGKKKAGNEFPEPSAPPMMADAVAVNSYSPPTQQETIVAISNEKREQYIPGYSQNQSSTVPIAAVAVVAVPDPEPTLVSNGSSSTQGGGGSQGGGGLFSGGRKKQHQPEVVHELGRHPVMMQCPACHNQSSTRVKTYPTWLTWMTVGGVALVFWPICWVPLVCDPMKKTDHYCVSCGQKVGSVEPYTDCGVKKRG